MDKLYEQLARLVGQALAERWIAVLPSRRNADTKKREQRTAAKTGALRRKHVVKFVPHWHAGRAVNTRHRNQSIEARDTDKDSRPAR